MNPKSVNELSHELIGAADRSPSRARSRSSGIRLSRCLFSRTHAARHSSCLPEDDACSLQRVHSETGYRIDILVDERIVVELKAIEKFLSIHSAQLLTYLRLGNFPPGLLVNFHVARLVDGIERVSNNAPSLSASSAFPNPNPTQ
ncbi:MAG TPA: GxxExxY protein [Opitutus sp.]|nr:GxxExxY protein [Opitutus sp.]